MTKLRSSSAQLASAFSSLTFAGRWGQSFLVVGLGRLATHSLEDYEALGLRWRGIGRHLSLIKTKLARKRTTYRLFK